MDDKIEVQRAFPDVNYRFVITPRVDLDPLYKELSLDHPMIERMINIGMEDALIAIDEYNALHDNEFKY